MRYQADKRRPTPAQLNQMVERAKEEQAKECQAWHPEINKRCLRPAGHPGKHQWQLGPFSKLWEWDNEQEANLMTIRRLQLTTERYSLTIHQSHLHAGIDVRLADNPTGGHLMAIKRFNIDRLEVEPAEVVFWANFASRKPEQIEALCDWIYITSFLAKQLDLFFTDRESFGANITVKAAGVSLVVREAEGVEALG